MADWPGWQNDFLDAAHLPKTAANRAWLTAWDVHASTNCGNNPIDLSHASSNSGDCLSLPGGRTSQHYRSHAAAAAAFNDQINSGTFAELAIKMSSSSLSTANPSSDVIALIREWGSTRFADWLAGQASGGGGGGTGGGEPAGIHKGWNDVRKSVNRRLPASLKASDKLTRSALRSLSRARRVKL